VTLKQASQKQLNMKEQLAQLEQRVAVLESQQTTHAAPQVLPVPADFWALSELTRRATPGGEVVYAGAVTLPGGEQYGWQVGLPTSPLLAQNWQDAAPVLAALGHPLRLELLRRVLAGERTVAEWQTQTLLSGSGKLYHHLRDLQAAGWLVAEGRGRYAVPGSKVVPLLAILSASGQLNP
jgi:DNA-binding transcriptional ArsR family regulator